MRSYFFALKDNSFSTNSAFRGHANASWPLRPTIERIRPEKIIPFLQPWYVNAEKVSVESYKRAIHLFAETDFANVREENTLEWLSIMQHHGAATRLLDVTSSPLIASFFALSDPYNESKEICIWEFSLEAIDIKNVEILDIKTKDKYRDVYNFYNSLKLDNENENPILGYTFLGKPSERPFKQKGGFLYGMTNNYNFEQVLSKYSDNKNISIKKLVLNITNKLDVARALKDFGDMNISYSSLFPGLDGYTKDLLLQQYITNI